jgi:5-methylcytosine-specific restriction endonuclease McrA
MLPNFKKKRIVLKGKKLDELRERILARDGWKCKWCDGETNLHIHHLRFRSQQGDDSEANMATLCWICHDKVHKNRAMREQLLEKCANLKGENPTEEYEGR